ncbi:MAG: PDZ domain-containing protein [Planctomycetia bacterium]|nr:PDZ domain-containing protein [Planctomycetia bacterium]
MKRILVCLLVGGMCCVVLASDIPPPRPVDVAALVQQLGSEDFKEREEASRRLAALPLDEPPAELLAALKSPNPEVRDRAAKIVQTIRTRSVAKRLSRGVGFAKRGEVDLFVAATATWDLKAEDTRLWAPAFEMGQKLAAKAEMDGKTPPEVQAKAQALDAAFKRVVAEAKGPNPDIPSLRAELERLQREQLKLFETTRGCVLRGCPSVFGDFPAYRRGSNPRLIRTDGVHVREPFDATGEPLRVVPEVIQAAGVACPRGITGVIVSRGDVSAKTGIGMSLILANGNVTTGNDISSSIVICDGDVLVPGNVLTSLIIARGNIKIGGCGTQNTLLAGGSITIAKPPPFVPVPKSTENIVKENEPNALGFITFFELSRIGLEVKAADDAVKVAAIADGKPAEKAGVKVGDTILEVNGKKPLDAESLRRLLRDALAVADATVKLKRGDKTEMVKVALPEVTVHGSG